MKNYLLFDFNRFFPENIRLSKESQLNTGLHYGKIRIYAGNNFLQIIDIGESLARGLFDFLNYDHQFPAFTENGATYTLNAAFQDTQLFNQTNSVIGTAVIKMQM